MPLLGWVMLIGTIIKEALWRSCARHRMRLIVWRWRLCALPGAGGGTGRVIPSRRHVTPSARMIAADATVGRIYYGPSPH